MGDETPQNQPEPLLTGDPDALHVFVVREGDLPTFLPPMADSQPATGAPPSGTSSRQPAPPSTPPFAGILSERVGTILSILTILLLLVGAAALAWSLIVAEPEATVLLIPRTWQVSVTRTIQSGDGVPLRTLVPVTLSRSLTVAATGTGHTRARQARGSITFYNGAFVAQTVPAGTALTGRDGTVIVTDAAITIPAAQPSTPPTYGQASVPARAVEAGSAGNIAALDINQACCATSVLAENLTAFTGGQDARTFRVVTQSDLDTAVQRLTPQVEAAVQARLGAALPAGETLAMPPCPPRARASANAGQAASSVTVTLAATCQGVAYPHETVQTLATTWLAEVAAQQAHQSVQLAASTRVRVSAVALTPGGARLSLAASGLFIAAWTARDFARMATAIAGHTVAEATRWLLTVPGVQQAQVTVTGSATLPAKPSHIHLLVELPTPTPEPQARPSP
jgi:hypothetical protein